MNELKKKNEILTGFLPKLQNSGEIFSNSSPTSLTIGFTNNYWQPNELYYDGVCKNFDVLDVPLTHIHDPE